MNDDFRNSSIDLELQVRLMNLVMGEASDFERDQLQALMEQRPELAAYCEHVEHLHGLLNEAAIGDLDQFSKGEKLTEGDEATADWSEDEAPKLPGNYLPTVAISCWLFSMELNLIQAMKRYVSTTRSHGGVFRRVASQKFLSWSRVYS